MESLKKGDHEAFETIFLAYFPKVKYYINGFVKSVDVAEDLTQNVFLKIWENHEAFIITTKGLKGLDSYVYTIAYRQTIDYIRSKQIRESFYNDEQLDVYTNLLVDTEEEYIAKETKLLIEIEIESMPDRQQMIYRMSRNEGVSNDKIAEQLEISKRTVENQLSLAMKRIRRIMSCLF